MADLATQIQALGDQYTHNLNDLHDDVVYLRMLWRRLLVDVSHGNEHIIVKNPITGSVTQGAQFADKSPASLQRLNSRTFKDIIAQFELFVAELLSVWLSHHPALISEKALNVATLLASRTLVEAQSAAVQEAVDSTIAKKMHDRPETWFNYLRKNLGIRFAAQEEASFLEMKARRDVLEHHGGIVDASYLEKAKDGPKYSENDLVQLADEDVDEVYQLARRLVHKATSFAIAKFRAA